MGKAKHSGPRTRTLLQLINSLLVTSVTMIALFRTILYQKDYLKQVATTIVNVNYNGQ